MSTKALEDLLDEVSERRGEGIVRAARAELEAIRKAAAVVARHGIYHVTPAPYDEVKSAEDLLAAIAEETP